MATDADKLGRTVVVDYGSDTIKAGRARDVPSERALSCVTPSLVEVRSPAHADASAPPGGGGTQTWPREPAVRRGRVVDVDRLEAILHHVLYGRMGWKPGKEDCLVVVEPVLASRAEREAIAQAAFEGLRAKGLFVADAAACALYTCNKQAGLTVDLGHGKAVVASVSEGATHVAGAAALPWAGEQLTEHVRALLSDPRVAGERTAAAARGLTGEQLRAIKEQSARAAASAEDYAALCAPGGLTAGGGAGGGGGGSNARAAAAAEAVSAAAAAEKQQQQQGAAYTDAWKAARSAFALPDGTSLDLGHAGYSLAEALLMPETAGIAAPALGEVCCDVVAQQMDASTRRALWETVLVTGGTGCLPGLRERLMADLPLYGPVSASFGSAPVPNYLPADARRHAAWMGGAVLARVAMHQAVTPNEYDEWGPAAINRVQ